MNDFFIERVNCPCCNSANVLEVYSLPYESEILETYLKNFYNSQGKIELKFLRNVNYTLSECETCKLIFQKFIPNDFLMEKLYEEWISPEVAMSNSFVHNLSYYKSYAYEVIDLIDYFNVKPNELHFLDFGMGWGKWCLMAKAFGVNSKGMELSEKRIHYAKKNGIEILKWKEIPTSRFDYINTEQVFEHIADPLETLKYLIKALKSRGIIKISVPNGMRTKVNIKNANWSLLKDSDKSLNTVAPLEHINCFVRDSIIIMAKELGLSPISIRKSKSPNTFKSILKEFLRPYYSRIKKPKNTDTSIFFIKK